MVRPPSFDLHYYNLKFSLSQLLQVVSVQLLVGFPKTGYKASYDWISDVITM